MTTLKKCNQHYIRCIKPNDAKSASLIDSKLIYSQAQYLGLKENVKVRRAGYALRVSFQEFHARYKALG